MSKQLLVIPLLLISLFAWAQSGSITGKILDNANNEPLIGATIVVKGTTKGGIADLDGKFVIRNVPSGSHSLQVSYVGFDNFGLEVTVTDGDIVAVDDIMMTSNAIGLKEIEVFASVVEDRKTPVAVSAINAQDLVERHSGVSLAEVVQNTPGVYTTQGAGGYGDQEVYIRGFDQSNVAFLVNGIPVNDMENGRMYWSNFAGLNSVTRQMQVQRGLGASKLAVSSIGGTINMITKPSETREGGRVEYQMSNGTWNNSLRFTYNSGQLDKGWAFSFQGSRVTTSGGLVGLESSKQGSILPGAFVDAWSYYLAISKTINDRHQLMFWGFGAPVNRGTSWSADDATREEFNITSPVFNNALGVYRGNIYNVRQNKAHKPMMAVSHYWDINSTSTLSTSAYYSTANVYSAQPRNSESSLFFPTRSASMPEFTPDNLIDWDYLAEQNRADDRLRQLQQPDGEVISGYASQYYAEARYNNHKWVGLISNYRKSLENVELYGGLDLRYYRGLHFAEVFETFGGDFVENLSAFGDDYDKLKVNEVLRKGDRINYDYEGQITWLAGFVQAEYTLNKLNLFATATVTNNTYQRIGYMWNSRDIYNDNSLGKSATRNFLTYTSKAGVSYSPTNRHHVYANAGYFSRPPYLRNAFGDSRYSNEYREGLKTEKVSSSEIGYSYRTSKIKANVNAYYLIWKDRTTEFEVDDGDFLGSTGSFEVPIVLNGLKSKHQGVELDFVYNATSNMEINGYVSYGDWKWDEAPAQSVTVGEFTRDFNNLEQIVGLPVGTAAQHTAGIGTHYRGIKNMYIGGRLNYADKIPISYSPENLVDGFITREVILEGFDDYYTVDVYFGRYFDLGDNLGGRISANISNIFNKEYVRWASYFFSQTQRGFGYPRRYTINLSIDF